MGNICIFIIILLSAFSLAEHTLPVTFEPNQVKDFVIGDKQEIEVWSLHELSDIEVFIKDTSIITSDQSVLTLIKFNETHYIGKFNITSIFLGYTSIQVRKNDIGGNISLISQDLRVAAIRENGLLDKIFVISVVILVSLIYINFGCALDWHIIKATIRRPIGPIIGFISQYLFMPTMSFLLARILFPDNVPMQLGIFFTGCSPGGGASNMWTVVLNGNLDLSVTMTTISTFSAFVMIPLWVFTLGQLLFETSNFEVPYSKITRLAAGLIIPLLVGTAIQYFLPKLSNILVKIMKPFAIFLIIFIVIFGTIAYFYIFSFFDWKVIIGGICIPWLGYLFGALLSGAFRQNPKDMIAIAVETGVQNTGITFYMLRLALDQPAADIALVCPVAVSLMTPIPLTILGLWLKCRSRPTSPQPLEELTTPTTDISQY